ncbi:flippase [Psychrobacter maritimus]|uniref:flippase n=1 Tax=Psychrobacter maritimus TaxID=256325 RepID=UPI001917DBD3|nr:flippase [Psychrobacter maritimus]
MGHEGIRRYGANTAWLMGEKVLRMFMGLFVGIWVARYLGPEQFGLLSYAQSFVFLFTAIATLGLDSIVVRELVKDNSQRNVLLGTAFTLKLIGSLCILPLLWLGVQFTSNDSYTNLLIFIIASGTIFQSFNVIDFYYQSSVLSKYVAFANTVTLAISSIIKIVLILNESSLLAFAIVGVFDTVVLSLGLIYFYWQKTHHSLREWQFDKVVAKRLLADSWPLAIAGLMFVTYSRVDQVMIQYMIGNNAVGLYSASQKIVEVFYFLPLILTRVFFPAIVNAKEYSIEIYKSRLNKLFLFLMLLSLLIAPIINMNTRLIVTALYGEDFLGASEILSWQIWSVLLISIGYINGLWLISENKQIILMKNYTYAAFLNIIINYFFINIYGVIGAVYASIVSQALVYYLFLWLRKDTRFLVRNIYRIKVLKSKNV